MLKRISGAAIGALLAVTGAALAQTYPTKPITMIIPFAAGGPTDVLGRVMAQRMSEILGQQVVVENVGGAGGMTGSKRVADAAPDGYTFVLGTVGTHAQSQTLVQEAALQFGHRFYPGCADRRGSDRADRAQGPARERSQGIHRLREGQPGKMQFGSAGAGSATHLGCVLLNYVIGDQYHARALSRHRPGDAGPCKAAASTSCARSSPPPSRRSTAAPSRRSRS